MHPSGPCFVTGPRGYFRFDNDYFPARTAKLLGIINGFHETKIVFDAVGKKWRASGVRSRWKKSWWLTLLANTVFNPRVDIEVLWRDPEPYTLEDLKLIYTKAVDRDDDILTQFIEADVLKRKIAEAQSFENLVEAYKYVDDDEQNGG
jgi:hypothetical protein